MKYDLLVTDGEVVDPSAGLKGLLDVAISGGKIVEVARSLPKSEARRTINARGLLVTPGLVDIHAHIFVNAHDMGGHTDHFCQASGVTTLCDAGSTGSATFAGLRHVIDHEVRTRVRDFLSICRRSASSAPRAAANYRISPMPTPRAAPARFRRTPIWRSGSSCATARGSCGNTPPSP